MRLTDLSVKALKAPPNGVIYHTDDMLAGFGVRVSQAGTKSFVLTHGPRRQRETIGRVGIVTLQEARAERRGDLNDPTYIENLPVDHVLRRNENVFPFSAHLASSLVLHALHVAIQPVGIADMGQHIFHFVDGSLDVTRGLNCDADCYFSSIVARGDSEGLPITGVDPAASKLRTMTA